MPASLKSQRAKTSERGLSLIELMIALTVLTVGLAALLGLLMTGIATNTRNKLDTGGTFAAQAILETVGAQPAGTDVAMADCAGNTFVVKTAGQGVGVTTGAQLMTDGSGRIDFSAETNSAVSAGYKILYVGCGPAGRQVTYDVRWNIKTIDAYSKLVTVAAMQTGAVQGLTTTTQLRYFNPPVNLRTIVATGN